MTIHFKRKPLAAIIAGMALATVATGQAFAQQTPAGTEINNRATVTYQDINGNQFSAQSNESTVVVAEVFSATLEKDNSKKGAPGQTVYFPHVLKNTGNTVDTFTLASEDDGSAATYTVYEDINANGIPDPGEPEVTEVTLTGGQQTSLVVGVPVPSTAQPNDEYDSTLTVESAGAGAAGAAVITDNGADGDSTGNTNQNKVTVTDGPVLDTSKSAQVDGNEITYTLQVTNNGSEAENVLIIDAIPDGTTFVEVVSVNGLLAGNSDEYDGSLLPALPTITTPTTVAEPSGIDMDGDGTPGEPSVDGILFKDLSLPSNATVSVVFKVSFDLDADADTEIKNTFVAGEEDDNNTGQPTDPSPSNETTTQVEQTYGVEALDTGNDYDDGGNTNDKASIEKAAPGSTVVFENVITNQGNGDDTFDLTIENDGGGSYTGSADNNGYSAFPDGTLFTFYNASNNTQLTDTDSNGIPDTGSVGRDQDVTIKVRAKLPSSIPNGDTGPFAATMTATSDGDPTVSDDKLEVLDGIIPPSIDLANTFNTQLFDTDNWEGYTSGNATMEKEGDVGGTVTFPLLAANNTGSPQSFKLDADLPDGWKVTFEEVGVDADGDSTPENTTNAGAVVTASPTLPAGGVYHYQAVVEISSIAAQALGNFQDNITLAATGASGTEGHINGDYPVRFTIESSGTGETDDVLDAVDINDVREISVTPDGQNQVEPGGNVDYTHVIGNRGNTTEELTLTTANSKSGEGWSNNTQLNVGGTWTNIANIATGTVNDVLTPDGSTTITVEVDNGSADPVLTLTPGQQVEVKSTIFAPGSAGQGDVDTYTLTATADTDIKGMATDTTEVQTGQVRLTKGAYVDKSCECDTAMPVDAGQFAARPTEQVEPEQCVIWRLQARNEGASVAESVTIFDAVTEFTAFESADDGRDSSGASISTAPTVGPDLKWEIGNLVAGDTASAQFCVKVN